MSAPNAETGSSSKENSDNSPSPSPSVGDAVGEWYPAPSLDSLNWQDAKVKCPKCKTVTNALFVKVEPAKEQAEFMEVVERARRLELCTKCGNLRLIT